MYKIHISYFVVCVNVGICDFYYFYIYLHIHCPTFIMMFIMRSLGACCTTAPWRCSPAVLIRMRKSNERRSAATDSFEWAVRKNGSNDLFVWPFHWPSRIYKYMAMSFLLATKSLITRDPTEKSLPELCCLDVVYPPQSVLIN